MVNISMADWQAEVFEPGSQYIGVYFDQKTQSFALIDSESQQKLRESNFVGQSGVTVIQNPRRGCRRVSNFCIGS